MSRSTYDPKTNSKICSRCKKRLDLEEFWKSKITKDGKASWCKPCTRDDVNRRHRTNPGLQKVANLKCKYGLSKELYEKILLAQGGVCAICKQPSKGKALSVDHNHVTGRNRGLICNQCNLMLGLAKDDMFLLQSAIQYLTLYKE